MHVQLLLLNRVKARWSKNRAAQGFHFINSFISNFFGPNSKTCSSRPCISRPYCNMYWQPLLKIRKISHCATHRSRAMVYVMRAIFPLADFPLSLRWYSNHPCRILWKHKLQLGKIGQNTATLCMYIHSTHHMIHTTGCISVIFGRFWSFHMYTGSFAPADFSGAVFTCAHFQKIA